MWICGCLALAAPAAAAAALTEINYKYWTAAGLYMCVRVLVLSPKNIFRGGRKLLIAFGGRDMHITMQMTRRPWVSHSISGAKSPFPLSAIGTPVFVGLGACSSWKYIRLFHSNSFGDRKHVSSTGEITQAAFFQFYTSAIKRIGLTFQSQRGALFQRENEWKKSQKHTFAVGLSRRQGFDWIFAIGNCYLSECV